MKIVIDIDENVFTRLFDNGTEDYQIVNDDLFAIAKAIRGCTTLPEGHGDLIDRNDLLKMTKSYKSELGRLKADPFVKCGIETVESFIKEMSEIIEADKE